MYVPFELRVDAAPLVFATTVHALYVPFELRVDAAIDISHNPAVVDAIRI